MPLLCTFDLSFQISLNYKMALSWGLLAQIGERTLSNPGTRGQLSSNLNFQRVAGISFALVAIKM